MICLKLQGLNHSNFYEGLLQSFRSDFYNIIRCSLEHKRSPRNPHRQFLAEVPYNPRFISSFILLSEVLSCLAVGHSLIIKPIKRCLGKIYLLSIQKDYPATTGIANLCKDLLLERPITLQEKLLIAC